ncbi:DUF3368 domain-containing protein [Methanoplanus endosymbiosus]|uniref:DUF3368 domain-containing protein n=1 Tax=Methanoplanus endosymbiosus TaxID=33865 RepID=A0A9E7PNN6_9EURY|nr:DUF3368 domain-containing protein [Methanoplanus endosymbiosus]UUX93220.1 DUF3368 domain-containing protein [Methanoplanus endosymbiosus]
MPIAVSNSSPLINLSAIGRINLLYQFDSVIIPPAVWYEVVIQGKNRPGSEELIYLSESGHIKVKKPENTHLLKALMQELHAGEAESIVLALEEKPDVVLLDETEARRVASTYELRVTGILGLLIKAGKNDEAISIKEEMDKLRETGNFWINKRLYDQILSIQNKTES